MERKPTVIIARPTTRSQKNVTYMGESGSPVVSPSRATRKGGTKKKNPP